MSGSILLPLRERARLALLQSPVFLDTETTGLETHDTIVEIAIRETDGTVLLESLVKPPSAMSDEVIGIHGITNEELTDAPTWAEVAARVHQILSDRVVVAHYAPFDKGMIQQTSELAGVSAPQPASWFCSMAMMLPTSQGSTRVSLARSMQIVGATDEGVPGKPHRAAYDAECCRRLVFAAAELPCDDTTKVA